MARKKLLLIEDEEGVVELVEDAIADLYDVEVASSLQKARELICEKDYCFIVADRQLPDGDSIELIDLLPSSPNHNVPFLFLSGKVDIDSKIEGLVTSAVDYVEKPFAPRELRLRISKNIRAASGD